MTVSTMLTTMAEGMVRTCGIFFLTLLFSLPLGMIIMLLRRSRITIVSEVMKVLLAIVRGTPLMLQLIIIYYGNAQLMVRIIYVGPLLKYDIGIVKGNFQDFPVIKAQKDVQAKTAAPFVVAYNIHYLIFPSHPVRLGPDKTLAYILVITHAFKEGFRYHDLILITGYSVTIQ